MREGEDNRGSNTGLLRDCKVGVEAITHIVRPVALHRSECWSVGAEASVDPCAVGDIPPCRVQSSSKPVAEIPPMKPTKAPDRRNELHNRISHLELEETPPDFEAELAHQGCYMPLRLMPDRIKHDNLVMAELSESGRRHPLLSFLRVRTAQVENGRQMLASNPENELVTKFQRLNIVRLAEAAKQMRWAVGSSRKMVQAIILDIVDPLRIVDGLWTMKVTLQDESVDSFMCLVDSFTLSSLIGLTPGEAMEVRASSDVARRKDGQRRLAAVEEQLRRLDLLLEVEMFSGGRADPVIRSIKTFMQALDA
ncbi:unnamed protein product [Heligmosomoides polygyrus]|uniref:RMI1_C domain-containing protein n=1 Tax=Heligmosomoides polygyrus TaxID=6339 RepID=A0A3P8EEA8_HELPZ|nr:unnamed protein product [Heligmosomoides polygyrus]